MKSASRRPSPLSSLLLLLFAAFAFAWFAPTTLVDAQGTPEPSQLLRVNEVTLKPETTEQWTALQRDELIPAQKKAGLPWRDTWASAQTGDTYMRAIVLPIPSLAQYDTPSPLLKAIGQGALQAFAEKNSRLVSGANVTVLRTRPDIGFGTRPEKMAIAVLTTVTVAPAHAAEFEAALKSEVVPALKKGKVAYYAVSQVVYGGDTNQYVTLLPVENFGALAKGHPLELVLGADGMARLTQKIGATITKLERNIIRHIPELSYGPPAQTSR